MQGFPPQSGVLFLRQCCLKGQNITKIQLRFSESLIVFKKISFSSRLFHFVETGFWAIKGKVTTFQKCVRILFLPNRTTPNSRQRGRWDFALKGFETAVVNIRLTSNLVLKPHCNCWQSGFDKQTVNVGQYEVTNVHRVHTGAADNSLKICLKKKKLSSEDTQAFSNVALHPTFDLILAVT